MGNLKPIGSEKLTGQEKIKRIMEIARYKEAIPNNLNETSRTEYNIGLADGNSYEIVKERQGYIIKKVVSEGVTEYIEPMKNRKYYSSYSQAFKKLNLLAAELNRLNENEEGISLFGEQKKVVLRTPKPSAETDTPPTPPVEPPSVPSPALPPAPTTEPEGEDMGMPEDDTMGDEDVPSPEEDEMEPISEPDTESSDEGEQVTFKTIQKLTGKLTQKIRTLQNDKGMTSEDMKYVINMVLSSLDLGSLSEEDKEDILSKFEEVEGEDMEMEEPSSEEDVTSDTEVEDIQSDMDLPVEGEMSEYGHGAIFDSIFSESKVDTVISKYFEYSKKELMETSQKMTQKKNQNSQSFKQQMMEVKRLSESIEQKLAAKKFLEETPTAKIVGKTNKNNLVFQDRGARIIKITPQGLLV